MVRDRWWKTRTGECAPPAAETRPRPPHCPPRPQHPLAPPRRQASAGSRPHTAHMRQRGDRATTASQYTCQPMHRGGNRDATMPCGHLLPHSKVCDITSNNYCKTDKSSYRYIKVPWQKGCAANHASMLLWHHRSMLQADTVDEVELPVSLAPKHA